MASSMHITEIVLRNYRQFRDFRLPLTEPDSNEPLKKICLIGPNGTGKSTLLGLLSLFFENGQPMPWLGEWNKPDSFIGFEIRQDSEAYYVANWGLRGTCAQDPGRPDIEKWLKIWEGHTDPLNNQASVQYWQEQQARMNSFDHEIKLNPDSNDLAIYASPDGSSLLTTNDLPNATLNDALKMFKGIPAYHQTSYHRLEDFWKFLIYQIKKRESDYQQYLESPEAQSLSVAEAKRKFELNNPEILTELGKQWNLILEPAGLEFDVQNAKIPIQLNENLQAYIRLKKSKERVPYNALSSGIRNFIFRIGHIYCLYFNRTIERGFLLVDEPESSLFPDLLFDMIERYQSVIHNTQFFVATQSPIIAAQFRPEERFILEFDGDGFVTWRRGKSPEGDDPNDLLINDFSVRSLYGKMGVEKWKRYLQLRKEITACNDPKEKKSLLAEYSTIGNAYNFAPNEIPQ